MLIFLQFLMMRRTINILSIQQKSNEKKKKKNFINFILIVLRRTNTVERGQRVVEMEKRRIVM
jgi:hypothetical protein